MDDIVHQAIKKWPHVPSCYGWLGLDRRGNWYLRDDQVQAAGAFATLANGRYQVSKGSVLRHDKLIDFIGRNYTSDASGQWFFQNGPQRVYVELEVTPLIWRVKPGNGWPITAHTGQSANIQHCILDEHGRLYLDTDLGFGLVHSQDMFHAAEAIEQGVWIFQELLAADLPAKFGYILSPNARDKNNDKPA